MSVIKHLKEHFKLGYPQVDEDGNLIASVVPRTDTLFNLLAVADAGDGEVASATDVQALVLYQGSPSVGTPFHRASNLITYMGGFDTSFPNGDTTMPINEAVTSPPGVAVADEFILPNYTPNNSVGDILYGQILLNGFGTGFTAAAIIEFELQYYNSVSLSWNNFHTGVSLRMIADGSGIVSDSGNMFGSLQSTNLTNATKIRVLVNNNSAATGTFILSGVNLRVWTDAV